MPFSRPTRDELVVRAVQDMEAELQNGAALIRRTFERATAIVSAGQAHTLHGHIAWAARQLIIDSADEELLVRWADIYLGANGRKAATKAQFVVQFTGLADAVIPAGTRIVRPDGVVFETLAADAIPSTPPLEADVTVEAVEAGAAGNTVPGTVLTLESPVADIDPETTVLGAGSDAIGGGADIESIPALLARLLLHLQTPPKAGGRGDYIKWALEVSGVTRAWELPLQLGPSTVLVLAVQDTFDEDGFYEGTEFATIDYGALLAYIEDRANVTAIVTAQAPVEVELDPDIEISPYTPAMEAAVSAQLNDLLLRQTGPQVDGSVVYRNQLIQAIGLTPGLTNFILNTPGGDVSLAATELLTLGTPTYSEAT